MSTRYISDVGGAVNVSVEVLPRAFFFPTSVGGKVDRGHRDHFCSSLFFPSVTTILNPYVVQFLKKTSAEICDAIFVMRRPPRLSDMLMPFF